MSSPQIMTMLGLSAAAAGPTAKATRAISAAITRRHVFISFSPPFVPGKLRDWKTRGELGAERSREPHWAIPLPVWMDLGGEATRRVPSGRGLHAARSAHT